MYVYTYAYAYVHIYIVDTSLRASGEVGAAPRENERWRGGGSADCAAQMTAVHQLRHV